MKFIKLLEAITLAIEDQEKCPWDRQEKETTRAYQTFCVYRDLGASRSMQAVIDAIGSTISTLHNWSSTHNWNERSNAFDDYMERQKRDATIASELANHQRKIEEFRGQNEKLGKGMLSTAAQMLELGQKQLSGMKQRGDDIPTRELPGFMRSASAIAETGSRLIAESLGVDRILNDIAKAEAEEE